MAERAVCHCNGSFYGQYQKLIQTYDNISLKLSEKFVHEKFASSEWLYSKNLVGHFGCVNAVAFSNKGGEYLASGGDDTRVLVWKVEEAARGNASARCLKRKHLSNIFCASFDSENKHIITAGNDDQILRHDFETGELETCFSTSNAIYNVCIHPDNDKLFITAGEHGVVDLYDVRTPSEQVKLAKGTLTFHSAIFNPVDAALFATASSIKGVELWDARVPLRSLKRFDSTAGLQCAMGITFDQTGRHLAAVRRKLPPVLYNIDRNTSLVEFHQDGYCNSCTMKSVCFGGKKDNFIITGSDDFNVYIWKVPKTDKGHEGIKKVEKSFLVLKGHRSIVNQVCFNKDTSMVCTAGVEKIIKMWSPFPLAGSQGSYDNTGTEQRTPYSRIDYARMIIESGRPLSHDYDDESTSEDPRMMAFFDALVQGEHEGSTTDSDLSSIGDDDDDDDNDHTRSSNVDILQRIRAMVFEQIRNEREEANNSLEDTNRTESRERVSESRERCSEDGEAFEATNFVETPDENVDDEPSGVGLERLREIISSQQSSTNTRKRIAELRRNCLYDEDEQTTATSNVFSEYEHKENSKKEKNSFNFSHRSHSHCRGKRSSRKHENQDVSDSSCSDSDIERNKCKVIAQDKTSNCEKFSSEGSDDGLRCRYGRRKQFGNNEKSKQDNPSSSSTSRNTHNSHISRNVSVSNENTKKSNDNNDNRHS